MHSRQKGRGSFLHKYFLFLWESYSFPLHLKITRTRSFFAKNAENACEIDVIQKETFQLIVRIAISGNYSNWKCQSSFNEFHRI